MSRVVVIGATGHIGTYLVPRLVDGGHEVIAVSRGARGPYHASPQWEAVTRVGADREAEDADGTFGDRMAALRPEVVIDLICFTRASAQQLIEALRPSRPLLVHCGTIWVHGPALRVPVTEDEPRTAYGEYGTGKAEIEALLHQETRAGHGASSTAMVSRWVYRSSIAEKSASSRRPRKAKVLASRVVMARSANCCWVSAATMTRWPSAVAKSCAKPPGGAAADVSSRSARITANSSAAENPGCFCRSSLRTYSMFCVLCSVLTVFIVISRPIAIPLGRLRG
jgi:NAD(P)-dependent dehydrogenase (short-subunit alcohol dehydrogenase family)